MKRYKDVLLKQYLGDNRRFADLWNGFAGEELMRAGELETLGETGLSRDGEGSPLGKREHDILKRRNGNGYACILGMENQEYVDYRMVIRSMGYELEGYERQMRRLARIHREKKDCTGEEWLSRMKRKERLEPVAVLVVYLGRNAWDGSRDLYGMTEIERLPEKWRALVSNYRMNLLDVGRFEHMDRFQTDIRLVFGFLRLRWDKEKLKTFMEENREGFRRLRGDAYDVIQAYGSLPGLKEKKEKYRRGEEEYDMCQAWEEIAAEEREEGRKEERITLIVRMLEKGMKIEDVVYYTGFSENEVKNLKDGME